MFIKVVETIITQEVKPKCPYKVEPRIYDVKTVNKRESLSQPEQPKYDVLYGDPLQRQTK